MKFKATAEDAAKWRVALDSEDKTLSDVCRDALNRFAARVEKKAAADEGGAL